MLCAQHTLFPSSPAVPDQELFSTIFLIIFIAPTVAPSIPTAFGIGPRFIEWYRSQNALIRFPAAFIVSMFTSAIQGPWEGLGYSQLIRGNVHRISLVDLLVLFFSLIRKVDIVVLLFVKCLLWSVEFLLYQF